MLSVAGSLVQQRQRARLAAMSRRLAGAWALGGALIAAFLLAAGAAGHRILYVVPAAKAGYPDWMRGPLAHLGLQRSATEAAVQLAVFFVCYVVVVACAEELPAGVVIASIVMVSGVFLLAPPMFSADVFSYIDYARLGVIHGLDPYTHGAAAAPGDAVAPYVRWHDVASPYGPLFTMASYALAHLSVPVTYWTYKAVSALAGLGCVAMVWRIAAHRGHDPRRAALFVGVNPLFVAFAVGGAHNDTAVELLVLAAIASALGSRHRVSGVQIALAALTKISAGLLLPFLLVGTRRPGRVLSGATAATLAVVVAALAVLRGHAFGFVPQLFAQQRMVAGLSVPNELGVLLGNGGLTPALQAGCLCAFGVAVLWLLWRASRGADWIACAGWATLAGLVTTAWLVPWYAVWLLPLAAIAPSRALRASTLAFCAYVVATRVVSHL
jgi:uncharacterized membrane protein